MSKPTSDFWINFPDPWPKARHAARRLVQPPFVRELAMRLSEGGMLFAATDDVQYAEYKAWFSDFEASAAYTATPELADGVGCPWELPPAARAFLERLPREFQRYVRGYTSIDLEWSPESQSRPSL